MGHQTERVAAPSLEETRPKLLKVTTHRGFRIRQSRATGQPMTNNMHWNFEGVMKKKLLIRKQNRCLVYPRDSTRRK